MLMQAIDNVAVAVENIAAADEIEVKGCRYAVRQDVPRGHKIALDDIAKGSPVIKYGRIIGIASRDIVPGDWVHSHNVVDITEELEIVKQNDYRSKLESGEIVQPEMLSLRPSRDTVMVYKRPNGDIGIRNNILVISVIQCSNTLAQRICRETGAVCITQEGGCLEFPDRLDDLIKGLSLAGAHPNTYGALVVSLGCQQIDMEWIAEPIRAAGKECFTLCMQTDGGFYATAAKGIRLVNEMRARAALLQREPAPISELILGTHCGGSDWTSGLSSNRVCGGALDIHEALGGTVIQPAARGNMITKCGSLDVLKTMIARGDAFRSYNKTRNGKGMSETNPTPGNKKGGLTTLEEKNLGTFESAGKGLFRGWIKVGERAPGRGSWAIDQCHGNNDSYECTGSAMCGAHLVLFTTGRGTMYGNACGHTVKICGNRETCEAMPEFIDYSTVPLLEGTKSLEESSLELYEQILDIAEGRLTAAEILGDYSWTIPHANTLNGEYKEELARCPAR